MITRRLRFGPADREEAYYRYIAFEVPRAWPSVRVDYSFDRAAAAVDLGLLGPGGFRGWSGGARASTTVAESWATPGYLPGAVAGDWSVMLGLYRLPPEGLDVLVTVEAGERAQTPRSPLPEVPREVPALQRPPARPGYRWVAGDLHCHSEHSDGALSLAALAALAKRRGLDFLAITDHNTVSHFSHLEPLSRRYGLTIVPGQEVTTPEGHANVFGPVGWVDFRSPANKWLRQAEEGGGLLSINHPVVPVLGWQLDVGLVPDLVELWHQSWDRTSAAPLEFWASLGRAGVMGSAGVMGGKTPVRNDPGTRLHRASDWRDPHAVNRAAPHLHKRPVPVGGSDFHRYDDPDGTGSPRLPGNPTTWVEVPAGEGPPAPSEIITGLKQGGVAMSASPLGPTVVRLHDTWVVTGGDGATLGWLTGPPWSPSKAKRVGIAGDHHAHEASFVSAREPGVAVLLDGNNRVLALCP